MSSIEFDADEFVEAYTDYYAWRDDRDIETCRENARKYATSLRGTTNRMGWFDWLSNREKTVEEATSEDVRTFLLYLEEQGLSGPTRTQARSGISQYYQRMDIDTSNPVKELEGSWSTTTDKEDATGERRSYLSKDDVKAMIENAPAPTLRSELIIKTLYQTGIRRMELATATVDNLDINSRELEIKADKTDEWRTVSFRESLRQPLNLWLKTRRKDAPGYYEDNPYLFPSPSNRGQNDHISGETIRKTVVDAADNAGIQSTYGEDTTGKNQNTITPHVLRHTFAVHAAENSVPAPHLKTVLGHHSLDITQIYVQIADQDAVDMLKKRGPSL